MKESGLERQLLASSELGTCPTCRILFDYSPRLYLMLDLDPPNRLVQRATSGGL
jgi:hypothetical protein